MDVWAVRMGEYKAFTSLCVPLHPKKYPTADTKGYIPAEQRS